MKAIKQNITRLVMGCVLALGLTSQLHAQLQFTQVRATDEGAIQLHWQSSTNSIYRVEYAAELSDQTDWHVLYDDYPSHGTNTFWLDTGNYFNEPAIRHPKKTATRFYRIVKEATNTAASPTVSITAPANSAVVSGNLTVTASATSTLPGLYLKLYVDGEEMPASKNGTNFVINTCEWPNGIHKLFITAKCESNPSGATFESAPLNYGYAVSAYRQITISNLITRYSFSEPFFDPDAGQTQQVSAVFAANANWTLLIQDAYSNTVRTAAGAGNSMTFNWDGYGDNSTVLPAGTYTYLLTAQTNGQSSLMASSGMNSVLSSLELLNESASVSKSWYPKTAKEALAAGMTSYFVKMPPLPRIKTNGVWVSWESVHGTPEIVERTIPTSIQEAFLSSLESELIRNSFAKNSSGSSSAQSYGGPGGQTTRGPVRPPTAPVNKVAGTFVVAYQRYGPSGISVVNPLNGILQQRVAIQSHTGSSPLMCSNISAYQNQAGNFLNEMKKHAWKPALVKKERELQPSHLKGSGTIFNQANLGLLLLHGAYGTSADFTAGACEQIYFPIQTSDTGGEYVRMSEMNFGSAGTNGLKWMALQACNSLRQENWDSMQNHSIIQRKPAPAPWYRLDCL